jgi:Cdc6-like AAA superfamily ATPase
MSAKSDIPEGWYFMSDGMTSDGAENQGGSIKTIQAAFIQFDRRAEKLSQDLLAKTFVDAEPLFIQLSSRNHQVLYGRRGTGKTHALKFLGTALARMVMLRSTSTCERSALTDRSIQTRSVAYLSGPRDFKDLSGLFR